MTKAKFLRYAELKLKEKAIEAELEALKQQLLDEMAKEVELPDGTVLPPDTPRELEQGAFIVTKRKTWTYSEVYTGIKTQLKEREKEEQRKGIATWTEERNLTFRAKVAGEVE